MSEKIIEGGDRLGRVRAGLREGGRRLVFTNGCFDILHVGHVRYLQRARALGDALLVAINSDRSVRALKGEGRPVMSEGERAEMLAALACVDFVTVFEEDSPRRLIAELLPDVLVKGGDYRVEQIAGGDTVLKNGGEVRVLGFKPGRSTSALIDALRRGDG